MAVPMLRVRARDGRQKLDSTTRAGMIFGSVAIGGSGAAADGSVVEPRFAWGTPFFFVQVSGYMSTAGDDAQISITGTTLAWHFPNAARPAATILYGVI